jgi:hypothetical protein
MCHFFSLTPRIRLSSACTNLAEALCSNSLAVKYLVLFVLLPTCILGEEKIKVGDLTFVYPSTWLSVEPTSFTRAAMLLILGESNNDQNINPERTRLEQIVKAKELKQALISGDEKHLEQLANKATIEQLEKLSNVQTLEVIFYYFGTSGPSGDAEAQVARWLKLFQGEPQSKREDVEVGGKKVTLFTATGTYMELAMFDKKTPKADYTLLGAIIPGPDAPVFIRLIGPKASIGKVADDFRKLSISPFAR